LQDFVRWLGERPRWLQKAALLLGHAQKLGDKELDDLAALCIEEAGGSDLPRADLASLQVGPRGGHHLRLLSIGQVSGINALAPRQPLELGEGQLTVVYGENATGKSGYVRILKRICGARDAEPMMPDVFEPPPARQGCNVRYEVDGVPRAVSWNSEDGVIEDLRAVDIFDTRLSRIVVTHENEVTYEPPILTFISDLAAVCEAVRTRIGSKQQGSQLPALPHEFKTTDAGGWYESLTADLLDTEIRTRCSWDPEDQAKLRELNDRLDSESPATEAAALRRQIDNLEELHRETSDWKESLSDATCRRVEEQREAAAAKRRLATLAAETAFSGAPLAGVGSADWRALWRYARAYSERRAYPEEGFPFLGDGSRCVLCLQVLAGAAKERLTSFEEFVKGSAEADARESERELDRLLESFGDPPAEGAVERRLDAAGIDEPRDRQVIKSLFQAVRRRHNRTVLQEEGDFPPFPNLTEWENRVVQRLARLRERAAQFEDDAEAVDRSTAEQGRKQLSAKKWVSEQERAVGSEVERLRRNRLLETARSLAATTGLSTKKGELAEQLISEAFADRFRQELERLSADRIRVQLGRTRTEKGHALHRVQLKGLDRRDIGEVLSEGEFRVVALAAFLADATVPGASGPFVLDDPISSLDQRFEEAVVQRLVGLAGERQVVVFTHRLSVLGLVEDYASKEGISTKVLCVRREPWGTGEPGETPLAAKRPESALRRLRDEQLAKAAKVLKEKGSEEYAPLAKALCSEYRILLERTIELVLLADIIQRHRRSIKTDGKLHTVAKVRPDDCQLIDGLMTKYSRYEHSQSLEAPVPLPEPAELERDLTSLVDWIQQFKKR
jgi:energy-coupling factor transporter ATP-binding protein EcfA2